jgi:hypothetical protein
MRISRLRPAIGRFLLLALGVAPLCRADITYGVSLTVGAASVTGTITSDGTLGALGDGGPGGNHIVDWNLLLSDPTTVLVNTPCSGPGGGPPCTVNLVGPPSGGALDSLNNNLGADLLATPTQLLFDFSGTDGGAFFFETGALGAVCFGTNSCLSPLFGAGESL